MTSKVEATQPDAWFNVVDTWRGGGNVTSQWCWEDTPLHLLNLSFFSFYADCLVLKWWHGDRLSIPSKRTVLSLRLGALGGTRWFGRLGRVLFPQPVTVAHGQTMLLKSLSVLDSRVDPISTTGKEWQRWVTREKQGCYCIKGERV